MKIKAQSMLAGSLRRRLIKASMPPADAPTPTTKKGGFGTRQYTGEERMETSGARGLAAGELAGRVERVRTGGFVAMDRRDSTPYQAPNQTQCEFRFWFAAESNWRSSDFPLAL